MYSLIKMKKKIVAGMFLILAIALALALGFEAIDRPSVSVSAEVYSPNETEDEEAAWIKSEIEKLKEKPEMQIGAYAIHRTQKEVVIWVYERAPENQQLHHEMIGGWGIIIAESPKPSVFDTFAHPPGLWIPIGCLLACLLACNNGWNPRKISR
ncbi:MAG TPA: hypothetical protein C5S37_13715 [Methanophagales archaeon]|nr:hypothetical protein [Methanophagales archaeon]HJH27785.1 hypothetical protein [Methanophagales archaeon]